MTGTTDTFAVALAGEEDHGWLAGAALAEAALDVAHGTVPQAREAWRSELLVQTEDDHRHRYLRGAWFPASRPRP